MSEDFLIKDTPTLMEQNLPVFSQIELSIQQMVKFLFKLSIMCLFLQLSLRTCSQKSGTTTIFTM